MRFGMIATWRMAYEALLHQYDALLAGEQAGTVLENAIKEVEDFANFISVGYGGLPNEAGRVQLDAAYMDGATFEFGAVAALEDIANPISVAKLLSQERFNSMRVGAGAKEYALKKGFNAQDMLSAAAEALWQERIQKVSQKELTPYDGHDTIGMVVLDRKKGMVAGTSSSGLFMKENGRVGDSPLAGSGLYVDNEIGGATATGLGEDLTKGVLSYETVRRMGEGMSPMAAAGSALSEFEAKLKRKYGKAGAMSLVCMNQAGDWGVASNVDFTFVVADEQTRPKIYIAKPSTEQAGELLIEEPSEAWLTDYLSNLNYRTE